jgi:hypothetical protein
MGSEFVQDPFWGNWATGLARSLSDAPGKALHNTATVESILAAREKRARDTEMWNTGKTAADLIDAATPQAKVDPSFRDVQVENQGPVNPADPTTQPGEIFLPPTTATESFIDPRALAAAEARRNLLVASGRAAILKDPSSAPAQAAQAEVGATGMPRDPRDRGRLQFGTTGRFPTSDESKLQGATNFTIYKDGQSTGRQFSTRDGRTTLEGRPIGSMYNPSAGETALESGAASMAQPNPIESAPIAQNNFNQLAAKIEAKIARGEAISNDELNAARAMRDAGWQKKIRFFKDPETEQESSQPHYDIVPPQQGPAARLFDLLDRIDNVPMSRTTATTGAGGAATVAPAATAAAPAVTGGGASAGAPVPEPLPVPASSRTTLTGPTTRTGAGNPRPVVDSYLKSPVVHAYENAKTGYATFMGNVPFNNQSSDLAMIVGAAKILDPPSVVREGEVENVRKTGGVMDKFISMMQGLKGESRLPPEVRMMLWNMVHATMSKHNANIKPIYEQHAVQLTDRNVDYKKYLPEMATLVPPDASYVSTKSGRVDAEGRSPRRAAPAPGATTTAPAATRPAVSAEDINDLDRKLGVE